MSLRSCRIARQVVLLASLIVVGVWWQPPCQAAEARAASKGVLLDVGELVVLPFFQGTSAAQLRQKKLEKNLDCQLRGLCATEQEALFIEADQTITNLVQAELRQRFADQIVARIRVQEAYDAVAKGPTDTPRDLAVRVGRQLGVDHALVGVVWRYQERVGSAMAASDPASVAFSLFVVEVASGKLVWQASFDKTQTALSENLFDAPMYLKKGMKWLTVEELSSYGVEKVLRPLTLQ